MNTTAGEMNWSDEQTAIFNEFESGRGHLVIEACAGTGKTTTVKEGISRAPEAQKCYVAFNKRNVEEAKAKITDPRCSVMSLNGLGFRFVLRNWPGSSPKDTVEYDRVRSVSPRADRAPRAVAADIVKLIEFAKNTKPFATLQDLVAIAQSRGLEPDAYFELEGWTTVEYAEIALAAMNIAKTTRDTRKRISFTDQLWLPVVNGWVRPSYDLVVVDECQDMNATQLILAQRSCSPTGRVVIVGDPRQAIYGFRGADVRGMERLKIALNAKVLPLTTTYRCPKLVVAQAQQLVPHYRAAETAPEGILRSSTEAAMLTEIKPGDAIISRKNAPLMGLCLRLLKARIPARIEGRDIGFKLLKIVGDLRTTTVPAFIQAVEAWGERKFERAAAQKDGEALMEDIKDTVETLLAVADEAESMAEVEGRLQNLFGNSENGAPRDTVVLSSVHKAKGLEWKRVYLLEATFVRAWSTAASEESNIKYVGITRAMSELVWVTDAKFGGRKGPRAAAGRGAAEEVA